MKRWLSFLLCLVLILGVSARQVSVAMGEAPTEGIIASGAGDSMGETGEPEGSGDGESTEPGTDATGETGNGEATESAMGETSDTESGETTETGVGENNGAGETEGSGDGESTEPGTDVTGETGAGEAEETGYVEAMASGAGEATESGTEEEPESLPQPSISIALDKSTVAVGEPIKATIKAEELPEGWYASFYWELVKTKYYEPFLSENGKTSSTIYPPFGVRGRVQYCVYDAQGNGIAEGESNDFNITGSAPIPAEPTLPADARIEVKLDKETVAVGETISASYHLVNAPADWHLDAVWLFIDNGSQHFAGTFENSTSSSFTPKAGTKGILRVMPVHPDMTAVGHGRVETPFTITGAAQVPKLEITLTSISSSVETGTPNVAAWSAKGGNEPYTYTYQWEAMDRDGRYEETGPIKTDKLTCSYTPTMGVSGFFGVTVTDADGRQDTAIKEFEITKPDNSEVGEPGADAIPAINITLDKSTVAVGEPITATWEVANAPEGSYTIAYWIVYDINVGGDAQTDIRKVRKTSATFIPRYGIEGEVSVSLYDADDNWIMEENSSMFTITGAEQVEPEPVFPDDAYIRVNLSKNSVAVGETISATYELVNAPEGWTIFAMWNVEEENGDSYIVKADSSQTASSFIPQFGVKGTLYLEPTHPDANPDSKGSVSKDFIITGGVKAPALTLSLKKSTGSVVIGSPITASWTAQGGTPPYTYNYSWGVYDAQEYVGDERAMETTQTSSSFIPTKGSTGHFWMEVIDSVGRSTSESFYFEVFEPAPMVEPGKESPTRQPAAKVTQAPASTPTVETLAKSVVVDEKSRDLPFVLSTTQDTTGQKALVISATQPQQGQESKQTMKWILSPDLVKAASEQGYGQICARRGGISVVLEVDALLKSGSQDTQVDIQTVETKTLPADIQKQVKSQALGDVYQVGVSSAAPGELVHVRFAADAAVKNPAIMVIRADGTTVLYPDVTITVDSQGQRSVDVMVENGAMCYLINR
ncbi:MAG: hypothetical protein ACOX6O_05390 [Christensenellales bacterium]